MGVFKDCAEMAEKIGVRLQTAQWYASPACLKRRDKPGTTATMAFTVEVDEDEDEEEESWKS